MLSNTIGIRDRHCNGFRWCPPFPCDKGACELAVDRTIRWAKEFLTHSESDGFIEKGHHVLGIIQGSTYSDLRVSCSQALAEMPFSGYAIGGVSVGEQEEMINKFLIVYRICQQINLVMLWVSGLLFSY